VLLEHAGCLSEELGIFQRDMETRRHLRLERDALGAATTHQQWVEPQGGLGVGIGRMIARCRGSGVVLLHRPGVGRKAQLQPQLPQIVRRDARRQRCKHGEGIDIGPRFAHA
jgi:hypothetical protein